MNHRALSLVVAGLFAVGSLTAAAQVPLDKIGTDERGIPTLAPLLEAAIPAVVNISVEGKPFEGGSPLFQDPFFRRFFGDQPNQLPPRQGSGSGVIIDAETGHVLTNAHVIEDSESITVTLHDGRSFEAEVVGRDEPTDVALLRIDADDLTELEFGDSDELRVGDFVVAIGNPFGLGQTVTSGIVSALGRSGINPAGYEDFIQTDASINPGNSGGALITLEGKLVGLNTAIITPSRGNVGIGFAVPTSMVRPVMEQLIEYGVVQRGRLGVMIQDLNSELAEALDIDAESGAVVVEVSKGSAAEDAGLEAGDVITELDGEAVEGASDLRQRIGMMRAGVEVELEVIRRDGVKAGVRAVLDELPVAPIAEESESSARALAGAQFGELQPGTPGFDEVEGVAVFRVEPGSAAEEAGLREGDVVVAVNNRTVSSLDAFFDEIEDATGVIALTVWRDGNKLFMILPS